MRLVKAVSSGIAYRLVAGKVSVAEGSQGPVRGSTDVPADSDSVSVNAKTEDWACKPNFDASNVVVSMGSENCNTKTPASISNSKDNTRGPSCNAEPSGMLSSGFPAISKAAAAMTGLRKVSAGCVPNCVSASMRDIA